MPFISSVEYSCGPYNGGGAAPTPIPKTVAGIQLWIDAADSSKITVSGGNITAITNKSGTNNPLYVSVGSTSNVGYITNTAIVCADSNAHIGVATMPNAPYDTFVVCTANPISTSYRTVFRGNAATGTHQLLISPNATTVGMWTGSAFAQFGSITQAANEKAMFYTTMAAAKTIQASKNGTVALTAAAGPTTAGDNGVIMWIGNSWANGTAGQGGNGGGQPFGQI